MAVEFRSIRTRLTRDRIRDRIREGVVAAFFFFFFVNREKRRMKKKKKKKRMDAKDCLLPANGRDRIEDGIEERGIYKRSFFFFPFFFFEKDRKMEI